MGGEGREGGGGDVRVLSVIHFLISECCTFFNLFLCFVFSVSRFLFLMFRDCMDGVTDWF